MSTNRRNSGPGGRRPKVAGSPRGMAARPAAEQPAPEPVVDEPRRPRKVPLVKRGSGSSLRPAGATPESDVVAAPEVVETPTAAGSRRLTWKLVAALGGAAVLLGGFATLAAFKPGAKVSNLAYVDNAQTEEVTAAAQNALVTLYAYNDKTIDKYPDAAKSVLTEDMRTEFDKGIKTTVDSVKQAKSSVEAHVEPIGVTVLDGDRAELLANLTVSAANDGVAQGSASGPEVVRMEKVDGRWLISGIVDR